MSADLLGTQILAAVVEVGVEGLGTLRIHLVARPVPIPEEYGVQPSVLDEVISTASGGDWEIGGIRPPLRR
ncbi:hypothetical protein [Nonomuraea jabiensis]|uniref:Uncharacterized protein n=1 Tax=Nonomuraea jabiensis TaxID=882448 RepID=A0A7W9GDH5_9ACTN|nr:hypothetical protein [Nonomuraea jabiensis]MBB5781696.1 hypothetical protein [Nonomuraea jabiensis]